MSRNEVNSSQLAVSTRGFGESDVAVVNGIEGAAKQADVHPIASKETRDFNRGRNSSTLIPSRLSHHATLNIGGWHQLSPLLLAS
jgi:hypothetical protein